MNRIRIAGTVMALAVVLALGGCGRKADDETYRPGQDQEDTSGGNPDTQGQTQQDTPTTPGPDSEASTTARATLQGAPGDDFTGTVTVTQEGTGVRVVAEFSGVDTDGQHAFHVHENGQCDHDMSSGKHFTEAGGHFNPAGVEHACPPSTPRHAGDLGNVQITNGSGRLEITTSDLSLSGPNSVIGKAFILHAKVDDCKTQPTGNAGDRLACGVAEMPLSGGNAAQPTGQ
ncbi:MAG TPA: superoxide dismutase family protein [Thermoanaerobaculia bacterium]|nr:superoxide dismutase family protein [Thermoanaerobaculia bacterium]